MRRLGFRSDGRTKFHNEIGVFIASFLPQLVDQGAQSFPAHVCQFMKGNAHSHQGIACAHNSSELDPHAFHLQANRHLSAYRHGGRQFDVDAAFRDIFHFTMERVIGAPSLKGYAAAALITLMLPLAGGYFRCCAHRRLLVPYVEIDCAVSLICREVDSPDGLAWFQTTDARLPVQRTPWRSHPDHLKPRSQRAALDLNDFPGFEQKIQAGNSGRGFRYIQGVGKLFLAALAPNYVQRKHYFSAKTASRRHNFSRTGRVAGIRRPGKKTRASHVGVCKGRTYRKTIAHLPTKVPKASAA